MNGAVRLLEARRGRQEDALLYPPLESADRRGFCVVTAQHKQHERLLRPRNR